MEQVLQGGSALFSLGGVFLRNSYHGQGLALRYNIFGIEKELFLLGPE